MAHKTFLQLANALASESGVSGNASAISTVVGQTNTAKRIVDWVRQAHNEIQNKYPNWRWMRSTFTVNTSLGVDTYAPTVCTDTSALHAGLITRFKRWWPYADDGSINIKRYLTSGGVSGEGYMTILDWAYFRSIYRIGTQNNGPVTNITIDPANNLVTGPKPDGIYTITGEYQLSRLNFTSDNDVAEFPEDFDDLIVYRGLEKYGLWAAAPEALERGREESGKLMRQLEQDQLPPVRFAPPLA